MAALGCHRTRYVNFKNTAKVHSYQLLGLRGGFAGKGWEVFGELCNLTGEDYIATFTVLNQVTGNDAINCPARRVRCTTVRV